MEEQKVLFVEHDKLRTYLNGVFNQPSPHECKTLRSGAVIPISLLSTHTLKLSDRLSEEELRIQVEIRMFEEGNLSADEEYTIDFIRHPIATEESILVEVFALSHLKADEYFAESLTKSPVIDTIVPGFMVYGALYPTLPLQNDLFIYWGDEEAYAAIYQEGRYIAHRSIETLASIAVETGLDLNKLKNFLSSKGLIEENYLPEELNKYILLQERIAKNIERIVHTINHKRGLFGLSGIDNCYLDFEGKTIPGIGGIFNAYGINEISISPIVHENTPPENIHDALCADFFALPPQRGLNLSPYLRKAPWHQRESGRFTFTVGGALALIVLLSIGIGGMIYSKQNEYDALSAHLDGLKKKTTELALTLKRNTAQLKAQQAKSEALETEISLYHGAEETTTFVRDMHASRQQFLLDATSELGRYGLGTMSMEQNGSKIMNLHIIADDRKRDDIAKFMRGMYTRGYQDVQTREIKLDNGFYNSLVTVTR